MSDSPSPPQFDYDPPLLPDPPDLTTAEKIAAEAQEIYRVKLLKFQREGVDFGKAHGGRALIADEMGLGKTVQSIVIAAHYASEWPLLIVCPATMRYIWEQELRKWLLWGRCARRHIYRSL